MEFLGIRTKSGAIVQPNSGEEMIRKFDFAYSTPGLTTGVVVYNPTAGDVLLDAWIEVDTAFNGTTPLADVSQFSGGNVGWFSFFGPGPVDLTGADDPELDSAGLISASKGITYHAATGVSLPVGPTSLRESTDVIAQQSGSAFTGLQVWRALPAKFTNTNPVKLVVTQTGQKGGTATGATQGNGTVYFLTGTPQ